MTVETSCLQQTTSSRKKNFVMDLGQWFPKWSISTPRAGPSPGFRSRGGQKTEGGSENRKGSQIFEILYWMYAATRGPNVKWGGTDFKWGGGHHCPPACDGPAPGVNWTIQGVDK